MEARITSWFATGLRREAMRLAKKNSRLKERELLILNQRLKAGERLESLEIIETIPGKADILAEVEDSIFIQEALKLLTLQQQKVIKGVILEGATELKIANQMGVSKQAVNRIKERALNKLRKHYVLDEPTGKYLIQDRQLP